MSVVLGDIGLTIAYFNQSKFLERDPEIEKTNGVKVWLFLMAFAPYWWRFWQCINKWYKHSNRMQLINSLKYFSKMLPPIVYYAGASNKVGPNSFYLFMCMQIIQTTFCCYWDFRWDWGLFIGTKKNTKYLRDEMKFPPNFYYTCMALNLVFRFWWIFSIFTITFGVAMIDNMELLVFVSMLVEAFRRSFWAILRIENEFFNNFEQYRDIVIIPPIQEER
jgi:hypothetical protein